eukprot:Plantae.Rhodophyta-Palmaria_palmata.ctg1451.p1 GENE.Plantae.Rhodophyta-Palmaria_palmata.ctg1451~~Plantae.Rhodophyta-Palmaria_palmata.ctg1451.p1  ORF type:complete len:232 (-),score=25.49 Plantae.Rhodophyta-Palmaria_palmata.ctg1451:405-1100(-)
MLFVGRVTTPLLAFYSSYFGAKKLTVVHVKYLSSVVLKSRKWDSSLCYRPPPLDLNPDLLVFTDASHYLNPESHKQARLGVIISRNWGTVCNNVHHPIDFATHGLRRKSVSAKGAESQAAYACAGAAQILRHLETVFNLPMPRCILVTDNRSLVSSITANRRLNDGYVTLDVLALRESFKFGEFGATWASGMQMMADSLTKPSAPNDDHRDYLNTGRIQFDIGKVFWNKLE